MKTYRIVLKFINLDLYYYCYNVDLDYFKSSEWIDVPIICACAAIFVEHGEWNRESSKNLCHLAIHCTFLTSAVLLFILL